MNLQSDIEEAVLEHTRTIRGKNPIEFKLHFSEGILHSLVYEDNFALKSTYDNIYFAKILLSSFSPKVASMTPQDFDKVVKSFSKNEEIKNMTSGAYPYVNEESF